jgi:DNA-binding MurR/RpiR family transcriptional regulator
MTVARAPSVAETVRDRLRTLTASERRAARTLLANYPMLGLETVAEFSARCGVSSPTILRFIARLGFAHYADFQRRLREEVEAQLKSPLAKAGRAPTPGEVPLHVGFAAATAENITETFRHMPEAEFEAAAALLADPKRRLHLLGGRFTDAIARYMAAHLRILRPGVHHIDGQPGNWRDQLLDVGRRDVLVVFDIRRYQEDLLLHAQSAAEHQASVVLLTDQWLSPIARIAAHVLPTRIQVPSAWDSSAALLVVVEALLAAVTTRNWPTVKARIGALEELRPRETG